MRDDVRTTGEPLERATRLANAGVTGVEADPEHGEDVRAIVMVVAGDRAGVAVHGYDDAASMEPLADMLAHLQALFAANGKTLAFMTDDQLHAGQN